MNKFTKQISFILLCLLFNSIIVFSQQTNGNTTIRSSIISFSDIVKNSLEHQDVNKKFIGNDYGREEDEEGEEVLPTYEVYNTANVIKDPFGKINIDRLCDGESKKKKEKMKKEILKIAETIKNTSTQMKK